MLDARLDALAETIHDGVYGDHLLKVAVEAQRRGTLDAYLESLTPEQIEQAERSLRALYGRMADAIRRR